MRLLAAKLPGDGDMTPADIQAMKAFIDKHRTATTQFDIVWEGETPAEDHEQAISIVRPWADAGVTWWMETRWGTTLRLEEVRIRIKAGPPRIS